MAPPNRAGEDVSIRRRRLIYRAAHRGTRELDLLLGPFAAAALGAMTEPELDRFEWLLDEPETDIQMWLLGESPAPERHRDMLARILDFKSKSLK
jgi:antitoxin CptB